MEHNHLLIDQLRRIVKPCDDFQKREWSEKVDDILTPMPAGISPVALMSWGLLARYQQLQSSQMNLSRTAAKPASDLPHKFL